MGFRITIQTDGGKELYISNGYGDFSVGPLDKLARKYRHTGTYDDQDSKQYVADQIGLDDGCYALVLGQVFNYLFEQNCLRFDGTTRSGFRLKDGKKIILRGS